MTHSNSSSPKSPISSILGVDLETLFISYLFDAAHAEENHEATNTVVFIQRLLAILGPTIVADANTADENFRREQAAIEELRADIARTNIKHVRSKPDDAKNELHILPLQEQAYCYIAENWFTTRNRNRLIKQLHFAKVACRPQAKSAKQQKYQGREELKKDLPRSCMTAIKQDQPIEQLINQWLSMTPEEISAVKQHSSYQKNAAEGGAINEADYKNFLSGFSRESQENIEQFYIQAWQTPGKAFWISVIKELPAHSYLANLLATTGGNPEELPLFVKPIVENLFWFVETSDDSSNPSQLTTYFIALHQLVGFKHRETKAKVILDYAHPWVYVYKITDQGFIPVKAAANNELLATALFYNQPDDFLKANTITVFSKEIQNFIYGFKLKHKLFLAITCLDVQSEIYKIYEAVREKFGFNDFDEILKIWLNYTDNKPIVGYADEFSSMLYWLAHAGIAGLQELKQLDTELHNEQIDGKVIGQVLPDNTSIFSGLIQTSQGCKFLYEKPTLYHNLPAAALWAILPNSHPHAGFPAIYSMLLNQGELDLFDNITDAKVNPTVLSNFPAESFYKLLPLLQRDNPEYSKKVINAILEANPALAEDPKVFTTLSKTAIGCSILLSHPQSYAKLTSKILWRLYPRGHRLAGLPVLYAMLQADEPGKQLFDAILAEHPTILHKAPAEIFYLILPQLITFANGQEAFAAICNVNGKLFKKIPADDLNSNDTIKKEKGKPLNFLSCLLSFPDGRFFYGCYREQIEAKLTRKTFENLYLQNASPFAHKVAEDYLNTTEEGQKFIEKTEKDIASLAEKIRQAREYLTRPFTTIGGWGVGAISAAKVTSDLTNSRPRASDPQTPPRPRALQRHSIDH
jgi:hypothetical protein